MSSGSRLMSIGGACLVASFLVFRFTQFEFIAWILLAASMPLIFEAVAWAQAQQFAGFLYNVDTRTFEAAYSVRSASSRLIFLYAWVFGILVARDLDVLPTNFWIAVLIFAPLAIWMALVFRAHYTTISAFMAEQGVRKRHLTK